MEFLLGKWRKLQRRRTDATNRDLRNLTHLGAQLGWAPRTYAVMRETLNATACAALLEDVTWSDPSLLAQLSVLAAINVMVIVGNCLVIAAVFCSSKLRSVTNLFIVSLAVADLLVGVAVLPFSATWEIFKARVTTNHLLFNARKLVLRSLK